MTNKRGLLGMNALNAIPVEDIEKLRRGVFNVVSANLPRVREVLAGTRKWDPQQARLYLAMLNKVMPELSASYSETNSTVNIDSCSPEQLRAIIAAETSKAGVIDVTPIDPITVPSAAPPPAYRESPIFPDETP